MSYINNLYLLNKCLAKKYRLAVNVTVPNLQEMQAKMQANKPATDTSPTATPAAPTKSEAPESPKTPEPSQSNPTVDPLKPVPNADTPRAAPPAPNPPKPKPVNGGKSPKIPNVSKDFNSALAKIIGAGMWTKKHMDGIKNAISDKRMNTFLYGAGGAFSPAMRAQHLSGVDNQSRDFLMHAFQSGQLLNHKQIMHGIDLIHKLASVKASPEAKAKAYKNLMEHTKSGKILDYTPSLAAQDIKNFRASTPEMEGMNQDQGEDENQDNIDALEEVNPGDPKKMNPRGG